MLASMSFLSTNLSSFHMPVLNLSSSEIQRNDHDNPIADKAKNDRTTESETAKSILNIGKSTMGLIRTT